MRFNRREDPLRLGLRLLNFVSVGIAIALSGSGRSFAAEQLSDVPAWLRAHVGEGEGQIARVVLERARALYLQKVREGAVRNHCYFAMDATPPHDLGGGRLGAGFTSSAKPTGRIARFPWGTAAVAIWQVSWISQTEGGARRTSATQWIPS